MFGKLKKLANPDKGGSKQSKVSKKNLLSFIEEGKMVVEESEYKI